MHWILKKDFENEETDAMLEGELFGTEVSLPFEIGEEFTPPRKKLSFSRSIELRFVTDDDSTLGRMTDNLLIYEVPGLIFSNRFVEFLDKAGIDNIQYYELEIEITQTGERYADYMVANLLDVVDCIDKEKSELIYEDGEIDEVDKLVLDPRRIPANLHIFRLAGLLPLVIVSDDFKKTIESYGFTGFVFQDPAEYIL
jgi:hypothetical protein